MPNPFSFFCRDEYKDLKKLDYLVHFSGFQSIIVEVKSKLFEKNKCMVKKNV